MEKIKQYSGEIMRRKGEKMLSRKKLTQGMLCTAILFLTCGMALASSQPYITSHGINFGSGNKYQVETDLNISGPVNPITFKRTYNSTSRKTGVMGHGWTVSVGEKLDIQTDRITLIQTGGRHVYFTDNNDGTWTNETGKVRTITQSAGGYILTEPSGTVTIFDSNGVILSKQDRNNITTTYSYNGIQLSSTIDTFGNTLSFTYANDRITNLITPVGTFIYSYDSNHNLVSVAKPDGTSKQYIYDDKYEATFRKP